jgi:hypothetical protein
MRLCVAFLAGIIVGAIIAMVYLPRPDFKNEVVVNPAEVQAPTVIDANTTLEHSLTAVSDETKTLVEENEHCTAKLLSAIEARSDCEDHARSVQADADRWETKYTEFQCPVCD